MVYRSPTAHVDWSYSTARLYHSCPRRFYYRHGQSGEDEDAGHDSRSSTAVQPPGARLGSVVHDCIAEKIDYWRENSERTLQATEATVAERLQQYVDENEDEIRETYAANEEEFDPDEFARSLIRTAQNHLETFFQVVWPQFDSHQYITHEQTFSFDVDENTVWVRPDFCTRSQEGDFVVTDWKTGPVDRFNEPTLQALTYGLWAHQEYEPDFDRILVQLVHTRRGEFDRTQPDEADINRIKDQIRADSEDWTSFQSIEDFQPEPEASKCQSCEFLSRCDAGQSILDEETD